MAATIERDDVRRLVAGGAQLVEVLPHDEYEVLHLAGAQSIPLEDIDGRVARRLDPGRPVIVYCSDFQ